DSARSGQAPDKKAASAVRANDLYAGRLYLSRSGETQDTSGYAGEADQNRSGPNEPATRRYNRPRQVQLRLLAGSRTPEHSGEPPKSISGVHKGNQNRSCPGAYECAPATAY